MTINIGKKQITIGVIVVVLALLAIFGIGAIKNSTYMKRAKQCQRDIHLLNYISTLLSSEIHDVWSDYIREDKIYFDEKTGKFYKDWQVRERQIAGVKYCENFSYAIYLISKYYEDKGVNDTLDSLYTSVKACMTSMTPPPKKYAAIHPSIVNLFHNAEGMYNNAISPDGSLTTYTQSINSLSADYKKLESQVDIEFGELDSKIKEEEEHNAIIKFL